jgi:nucleotide-binding universal stress UspA family protein
MKVLVATDGSAASGSALRFALRLASAAHGTLDVITVSEIPAAIVAPGPVCRRLSEFEREERRLVASALQEARRLTRGSSARVRFAYVPARRLEPYAETITRAARRVRADLVVVGSRGGTATSRSLLGSIPNRLVHTARVPIALVRAGTRFSRRWPRRVLVATDGSRTASRAVRYAGKLVSLIRGARLSILHVATLPAGMLDLAPTLELEERRKGARLLERARRLAGAGSRATVRFSRPSRRLPVVRAILEEAERLRADVLVLGRTGLGSFREVLLGSVSQRALTLSRGPVILVS